MWEDFSLYYDGVEYKCYAKVFDKPSIFGIRRGRISKLDVTATDPYDGKELVNWQYDRGWPENKDGIEQKAPEWFIDLLMKKYPETKEVECHRES